jgi:hypothetical protein
MSITIHNSHSLQTHNDDRSPSLALPEAPLPVPSVLSHTVNPNPSSTRTSVTRVEHDEEHRPRLSISNDLAAPLTGTTPTPGAATINTLSLPSPVHEEERAASTPKPSPL